LQRITPTASHGRCGCLPTRMPWHAGRGKSAARREIDSVKRFQVKAAPKVLRDAAVAAAVEDLRQAAEAARVDVEVRIADEARALPHEDAFRIKPARGPSTGSGSPHQGGRGPSRAESRGGGHVLMCSNCIHEDVRAENFRAYMHAYRDRFGLSDLPPVFAWEPETAVLPGYVIR